MKIREKKFFISYDEIKNLAKEYARIHFDEIVSLSEELEIPLYMALVNFVFLKSDEAVKFTFCQGKIFCDYIYAELSRLNYEKKDN